MVSDRRFMGSWHMHMPLVFLVSEMSRFSGEMCFSLIFFLDLISMKRVFFPGRSMMMSISIDGVAK